MVSEAIQKIQNLIDARLLSARIISPRFEDYQIISVENNGEIEDLGDELDSVFGNSDKNNAKQTAEQKKITDEQALIKKDIGELRGILNGPQAQIENQLTDFLSNNPFGKATFLFLPLVGLALSSPEIAKKIIDMLLSPGGPFDKRLKIILAQQEEQFLSREAQKRRQLGLDQVIISQSNFGNANGRLITNTLTQVKSTGTSDIGLDETAIGMR